MSSVVYIDDEPLLCDAIELMLIGNGIETCAFSDPIEALAYLERTRVHVVVCDYRMPILDGLELRARLTRDVPFYLVSGELDVTGAPGIAGVLHKPFLLSHLLEIVRKHVPA